MPVLRAFTTTALRWPRAMRHGCYSD